MIKFSSILFLIVLMLGLSACSQKPAEIHYGNDECVHCKMMITDNQFASQLVTDKGKAYKFDSIECMAVYHRMNSQQLEGAALWVSDYNNPGTWHKAEEALYVKSEVINSPMGESLLAFASDREARQHIQDKPGKLITWQQVAKTEMQTSMKRELED